MITDGPVRLRNARISGSVYLAGAKLSSHGVAGCMDVMNDGDGAGSTVTG